MAEQRVIPMLAYEDASRAADWITKVFGFREIERFHNGAGTVTDVVLDLDGATVLVGHPSDLYQGPRRHAQACALARQWLETPIPALQDQRPLELVKSEPGAREVEDLIGRIEHGIIS